MRLNLAGFRKINASSTWAVGTVRLAVGWLARVWPFLGLITVTRPSRTVAVSLPEQPNAPVFEARRPLPKGPAFGTGLQSDRPRLLSPHRRKLRSIYAQNIARVTVEDGHFLLIAGTFQDPRVVHYGGSVQRQLRDTSRRFSVTTSSSSEPNPL